MELERVAEWVAHAEHENQADAGEQVKRREEGPVAAKAGQPPDERDQMEAGKVEERPGEKLDLELARRAHDHERLQAGQWQKQAAVAAQRGKGPDVTQRTGGGEEVIGALGDGLAL